jgi:hypothetical protein
MRQRDLFGASQRLSNLAEAEINSVARTPSIAPDKREFVEHLRSPAATAGKVSSRRRYATAFVAA